LFGDVASDGTAWRAFCDWSATADPAWRGAFNIIRMVEPDRETIGFGDEFGAASLEGSEVSPPNRRSPTETSQDPE